MKRAVLFFSQSHIFPICWVLNWNLLMKLFYTPRNEVRGGVYWNHPVRPSVCLSVSPSVCRRARLGKIAQLGKIVSDT